MDENIENIDTQIKKLKEKKKELKNDKLNKKIKDKIENKQVNYNSNKLIRVSNNFDKEITNVQNKRIEIGMDETFVSKPKITDLIIKHNHWFKLKDDIINFNFEEEVKC